MHATRSPGTKREGWSYEREWRAFAANADYMSFDAKQLGAVILECKITRANERKILQWGASRSPKLAVKRAAQHPRQFRVTIR